jgi:hypothetical protein
MSEHVTIKITKAARVGLKHIAVQTGEKQYALVGRLVMQEKDRLADLERASRLPRDLNPSKGGKWVMKFNRKPGPRKNGSKK